MASNNHVKKESHDLTEPPKKKMKRFLGTSLPIYLEKPELPEITEETALTVDLHPYALSHDYDIQVGNATMQFPAHKAILAACSKTFKAMLDGDSAIKKLPLMDISDQALQYLQAVIYETDRELDLQLTVGEEKELLVLVSKYGILFVKKFAEFYFSRSLPRSAPQFEKIHRFAKELHLEDIAEIISETQVYTFTKTLSDEEELAKYEPHRVNEFFCRGFTDNGASIDENKFLILLEYGKTHKNQDILANLLEHVEDYPECFFQSIVSRQCDISK